MAEIRDVENPIGDALKRAETWEPSLSAWAHLDVRASVAERAAAVDEASALAGVPFGVKDIIDVAGQPTRYGSAIFADAAPAERDAPVVAALRAVGAVPIGKTQTTEFAFIDPTVTRNPFKTSHTPGGSSSGSGAVVGAGIVPFALGTQTAGSLIRPACYCGVAAYKPSLGLLPQDGVAPLARSFDQLGIISADFASIRGFSSAVSSIMTRDLAQPSRQGLGGVRVAILDVPEQTPAHSQRHALAQVANTLKELGASVETCAPAVSFTSLLSDHRTIMLYEAARDVLAFIAGARGALRPKLAAALREGQQIPHAAYEAAHDNLRSARSPFWSALAEYDFILAHPVPGTAPADLTGTGDQSYLSPWTALGGPMVSIPVQLSGDGLPLAVMVTSRPDADLQLIADGSLIAANLPPIARPRLPQAVE